jgi:sphinganine-1-phosphate aldolase
MSWRKSLSLAEHALLATVTLAGLNTLFSEGVQGVARDFVLLLKKLPLVNSLLSAILDGEVADAMKLMIDKGDGSGSDKAPDLIPIPDKGVAPEKVIDILNKLKGTENAAEEGKAFAYTYTTKTDMQDFAKSLGKAYELFSEDSHSNKGDHEAMLKTVWDLFMHSNGLNPMMYPSLRRFETEIISMCLWMVNGSSDAAGSLTSGGTESILMGVKSYRDLARDKKPYIKQPNMVCAHTIHPAFEKAAHYFDVEIRHVGMTADMRMDVEAARKATDRNTILIVGSAPQYCHGVIDPIEALSDIAIEKGVPLHVDACFGGFMLPWLERIGNKMPLWDFRVPGVTSISADIHKYGFSSKGASVILYRSSAFRKYQYFAYAQWPGGLFGSPSLAGSRPGGMIAAAWAALIGMGQSGYMDIARQLRETTNKLCDGVKRIEGVRLVTTPDMTCLSIMSDSGSASPVSILAVADIMEGRNGWKMERQQLPDSLHLSILPQHARTCDLFIKDLEYSVQYVREHPETANQGTTGVYGMVAKVPDKTIIDSFIVKFFGSIFSQTGGPTIVEEFGTDKGR